MWTLVIAMLVILVLAALVVLYVAFPHRGEDVPAAPWLGDALRKGVESAPTLDNTAQGGPAETAPMTGPEIAPEARPETGPETGSLGFTFSEPESTGPSHRDG
jgi:hypothetical protein